MRRGFAERPREALTIDDKVFLMLLAAGITAAILQLVQGGPLKDVIVSSLIAFVLAPLGAYLGIITAKLFSKRGN